MLRRRGLLAAAVNCTFVADENCTLGTCPFHKLELHEIGKLPVLPPSSVATRLRAVVQVRKRPGCAPQ